MDAPILRFDCYNRSKPQTSSPSSKVWLEILRGRVRNRTRPVFGPVFLIGTAPDCDLVLAHSSFPETYAYLLIREDDVTIRHVAGGPELLINGEQLETSELASGDRLAFGPFELAVHIQFAPTITTMPSSPLSTGNWPWLADLAEA